MSYSCTFLISLFFHYALWVSYLSFLILSIYADLALSHWQIQGSHHSLSGFGIAFYGIENVVVHSMRVF